MTIDNRCWVCGSERTSALAQGDPGVVMTSADLRITDKRYGLTLPLTRCDRCGFVFARRESLPDLVALYEGLDDEEYESSDRGRRRQMEHLLRWATRDLAPGARLLDVGAATGLLVAEAQAMGYRGVGIEPSHTLAAQARADGLDVHDGVLGDADVGTDPFDLVTVVDVIEHVDDPVGLLEECRRVVAPGGRLLVVTPDLSSVAASVLKGRWWHRRLAHVGYFDRATLTAALDAAGFTPQRWTRPRWYLPAGYLLTRVRTYLPAGLRGDDTDREGRLANLLVPLNLFDSLAVVAGAR